MFVRSFHHWAYLEWNQVSIVFAPLLGSHLKREECHGPIQIRVKCHLRCDTFKWSLTYTKTTCNVTPRNKLIGTYLNKLSLKNKS